jgi:ABC-2 type transport system permease protein
MVLAGLGTLARFGVRRDRVWLPIWVAGIVFLVLSSASSVEGLYPTRADLTAAAAVVQENSTVIAMNGPAIGLDTLGGRIVFEVGAFGYVVVALMNMFLIGRHTRADEESGRLELIRAAAVGRHAPIAAAFSLAAGANVVMGGTIAVGLVAMGLSAGGSAAYGAALAAAGFAFAAIALVAAQLAEHTRTGYGITGAVIGVAFVLRAVGDAGNGVLSWLSPIGWGQAVRPYAGERWWALAVPLLCAAALCGASVALNNHRDLGAGHVQSKPGAPRATPALLRPFGLAVRLQRASLASWTVGMFLVGIAYGSIAKDIDDFIGDNEALADVLAQTGGDLTDSYFATTILVMAVIGAGFAVQSSLRPRGEEVELRAEPVLATAQSRVVWAGSHIVVAAVGVTLIALAAGAGAGLAYGISISDFGQVPRLAGAALVHVPAAWVLVGVTVALFGLAPRAAKLAWAVFAVCALVATFGELLGLPSWLRNVSPFAHVPQVPAFAVEVVPLVVLAAVATVLTAGGLAGFRHRDVG